MPKKVAKQLPVGKGKLGFRVSNYYPFPAAKVWDAIAKAEHVQRFFVDKMEGDYTPELAPVVWQWKEWGRHTHWPTVVQKEKRMEFRWANHSGDYLTTVSFTLKKKGKLIELQIEERGWKSAHLSNAFDNCSGWTMYLDYLKAYLLKGLDLRTVKGKV